MKELLEKISSYNIFNFLLPGTVFAYVADELTNTSLVQADLVVAAFLYYFLGLVINRVGSIVVQPILQKMGFITFADYKDYVAAADKDPLLPILSQENNTLRTLIAMTTLVPCTIGYTWLTRNCVFFAQYGTYLLLLLLLFLFLYSYRKQTSFIVKRVEARKES